MSEWKEKALSIYKNECFKQTMPYQYEIAFSKTARGVQTSGPLVSALGNVIEFPDLSRDVLDFSYVMSEYVVFLRKDGMPEANVVEQLLANAQGADIVYPDEDFLDLFEEERDSFDAANQAMMFRTPWRKPDYSPDTLMSFPYIETCFAVRTAFARTVPVPPKKLEIPDEVRVYDFLLRCMQKTSNVTHVTEILFHRFLPVGLKRDEEGHISDSAIYEALYKFYNKPGFCLARDAARSRLGYDELPESEDGKATISIIIPSKDHAQMLRDCIDKVLDAKGGNSLEIIVIDNGSEPDQQTAIKEYLDGIKEAKTQYFYEPSEFNFAAMCNKGAAAAEGEYLLFLNDDVEADSTTFLTEMLKIASLPHIGAVGVKLLYPDWDKIQHVGVCNIKRGPSHKLASFSDKEVQYFGRNRYIWDVLAVTGACLMVSREKYFNVGGFHDKMKVGYNDVDLCVKLYESGLYNVVDCGITLIHHESVTRGYDALSSEKRERLHQERTLFYECHPWLAQGGDPFLNPYLDQDTVSYNTKYVAQYQMTDYRNAWSKEKKYVARPSDKVSFNIERCDYEVAIDPSVEDAYVIEGWSLINKRDNAYFIRLLCLTPITQNGEDEKEHLEIKVSPKYREDVRHVFPEAKNARLAGFVCRIPVSVLDETLQYRIGMAEYNAGIGRKYMTLGAIYEPGKGIVTDGDQ